jgi:hypothetical protein
MSWLQRIFAHNAEPRQTNAGEVLVMVEVIQKLKDEVKSLTQQRDDFRDKYLQLREQLASGEGIDLKDYIPARLVSGALIDYKIEEDDEYCHIIHNIEHGTISFTREFNTTKANHNWVNEGEALVTLRTDNLGIHLTRPTMIKAPTSGIFESDNNKLIKFGEEICRIKKVPADKKAETLERLERESIKSAVLQRERKKMIERQTLDELIEEGKVFNIYTKADGNRTTIPSAVANAVWNRDGGRCCMCGSKENLEFDHIIPISKGGATTFRNLQLLCHKCNLIKSDNI